MEKVHTLPETNSKFTPENRPGPKRKPALQPSIFRGYVYIEALKQKIAVILFQKSSPNSG